MCVVREGSRARRTFRPGARPPERGLAFARGARDPARRARKRGDRQGFSKAFADRQGAAARVAGRAMPDELPAYRREVRAYADARRPRGDRTARGPLRHRPATSRACGVATSAKGTGQGYVLDAHAAIDSASCPIRVVALAGGADCSTWMRVGLAISITERPTTVSEPHAAIRTTPSFFFFFFFFFFFCRGAAGRSAGGWCRPRSSTA